MNQGIDYRDQIRFASGQRFAAVQGTLRDRARRREHLCSEVLTEPAWDVLLELYAYNLLGVRPTIAELTHRINVPSTTSLRWIKVLEAEGLVTREIGPGNSTEVCAVLSRKGLQAMDRYFSEAGSGLERD